MFILKNIRIEVMLFKVSSVCPVKKSNKQVKPVLPLESVKLEYSKESLLRNFHITNLPHTFFTCLLFFQ